MKNIIKIVLFFIPIAFCFSSCEIEEPATIQIIKPRSILDVEFLQDYKLLKTYVDKSVNPYFKLSAQTSLTDFADKGLIYRLLANNFDQVAPSGILHRAIIENDGSYNWGNIPAFISVASDAGISVFGQPLVWHAEQRAEYLNSLIIIGDDMTIEVEHVTNGKFEGNLDGWNSWGPGSEREHAEGEGVDGSNCFKFTNPSVATNAWDAQVEYRIAKAIEVGTECVLTFMVKASASATGTTVNAQMQDPSNNAGRGSFGSFNLTTGWNKITLRTTITGDNGLQLLFNFGRFAGTIFIDDVSLITVHTVGAPGGGSLTDVEKAEIATEKLEQWIEEVMGVAGEYVNDWVVVNEPMDDANPSQLRTAPNIPVTGEFYWQDYLGENYARIAVDFARKHHGGNDLKLFVNETSLFNPAKYQGLIDMIAKWEADGKTKIDGISAQLNLTCSLNEETQKANEEQIVALFTKLAQTNKLIRITALDMSLNSDGTTISTANMTIPQQLVMARYYNFIVRKYFDIIPAALRYGINIGNPIETTSNVG